MTPRYLEDWTAGDRFETGTATVTRDAILAFAAQYDPQPFHLDDDAAEASIFGGLAASGWQTASYAMRLLVETGLFARGGLVGLGVDDLRWPVAVRPGDVLRVESVVESVVRSATKPRGVVRVRNAVRNQAGVDVLTYTAAILVPTRPAT